MEQGPVSDAIQRNETQPENCQCVPAVSEKFLIQIRVSVGNCPLDFLKKIPYGLDTEIHKKVHISSKCQVLSSCFFHQQNRN